LVNPVKTTRLVRTGSSRAAHSRAAWQAASSPQRASLTEWLDAPGDAMNCANDGMYFANR